MLECAVARLNAYSKAASQSYAVPPVPAPGVGVSKQGAMDLLNPLLEAGLVRRIGTKKSGRYILG